MRQDDGGCAFRLGFTKTRDFIFFASRSETDNRSGAQSHLSQSSILDPTLVWMQVAMYILD